MASCQPPARNLGGDTRGETCKQLHTSKIARLFLLFLLFSSACARRASHAYIIPSLDHEPIGIDDALHLGRKTRPYVIEATNAEAHLAPGEGLVSRANDSDDDAFGHKVALHEILDLLVDSAIAKNTYTPAAALQLLRLVRSGYVRLVDEYRLGGECQSVWAWRGP